jgi:beta-galactosidase
VDVVGPEADLAPYALVIAPQTWIMTPARAARWRAFVEQGGCLVATWDTAMADPSNRMLLGGWPGEGLVDLFGIYVDEVDRCTAAETRTLSPAAGVDLGPSPKAFEVFALGEARGAEVLATYAEEFYAGRPVLTRNRVGRGEAWFVAARLAEPALDAFLGGLAARLELPRALDAAVPPGVQAHLRGAGDDMFLILLNTTNAAVQVPLGSRRGTCLECGGTVASSIELPPLDGRVVRLHA